MRELSFQFQSGIVEIIVSSSTLVQYANIKSTSVCKITISMKTARLIAFVPILILYSVRQMQRMQTSEVYAQ